MTVRQRILALRLMERQEENKEYMQSIGLELKTVQNDSGKEKSN